MQRTFVGIAAALMLAGCGGGGGGSSPNPPGSTPTPKPTSTASGSKSAVTITIAWPSVTPASSGTSRKPLYLSNSTLSVVVYLDGTAAATIDNPCTSGPVTITPASAHRTTSGTIHTLSGCTSTSTTINTTVGYHTFGATGFTATGGGGTALATSVTPAGYTVTLGGGNIVTVTMNGIVSSVVYDTSAVVNGAPPGNVSVLAYAKDFAGNTITGTANYANAMTVALSDPANQFTSFTTQTFSAPANAVTGVNTITLHFSGTSDCTAQLLATAPAVPSLSPALSTVNTIDSAAGNTASPFFSRAQLCWSAIGGSTAYNIYRGPSSGGENPAAIASVGPSTFNYQDYTVYASPIVFYKVCNGPLASSTCSPEFSGSANSDPKVYLGTAPTYWYDINDQNTVTVSQVQDKSGGANTLNLTGMVNTANVFNGRNALSSSVPNVYAQTTTGSINPASGVTVFVVASQNGPAGAFSGGYQRLINFGANNDGVGFIGTASNGLVASFFGNGGFYDVTYTGPATTWTSSPTLYAVQADGVANGGGSNSWLNGMMMNNVAVDNFIPVTGMNLGAWYASGALQSAQGWNGYIAEILVYPLAQGNIGTTQRQKIEGYLACKWGFQGSLPVGHPYRSGNSCP